MIQKTALKCLETQRFNSKEDISESSTFRKSDDNIGFLTQKALLFSTGYLGCKL
jgi:hypothetical protein